MKIDFSPRVLFSLVAALANLDEQQSILIQLQIQLAVRQRKPFRRAERSLFVQLLNLRLCWIQRAAHGLVRGESISMSVIHAADGNRGVSRHSAKGQFEILLASRFI